LRIIDQTSKKIDQRERECPEIVADVEFSGISHRKVVKIGIKKCKFSKLQKTVTRGLSSSTTRTPEPPTFDSKEHLLQQGTLRSA